MAETKFTPGPWKINERAKMNVRSSSDVSICSCGGDVDYEQACENARLIAASPEMYDFIDSFIRQFECDYMVDGKIIDNPSTLLLVNYNHAKQVISKARCESINQPQGQKP